MEVCKTACTGERVALAELHPGNVASSSASCAIQNPAPAHAKALQTVKVAVVHSATTGLDTVADEVVEFCGLLAEFSVPRGELLRVLRSYESLRTPRTSSSIERGGATIIPEAATRIHGITNEQAVRNGVAFSVASVVAMISEADIVVSHNAKFDCAMVCKLDPGRLATRQAVEKWACSLSDINWDKRGIPGGRLSLYSIADALGVARPSVERRAGGDARALLEVLRSIPSDAAIGQNMMQPRDEIARLTCMGHVLTQVRILRNYGRRLGYGDVSAVLRDRARRFPNA
jgi:DNA polymerase III epsilon subunit-like protein